MWRLRAIIAFEFVEGFSWQGQYFPLLTIGVDSIQCSSSSLNLKVKFMWENPVERLPSIQKSFFSAQDLEKNNKENKSKPKLSSSCIFFGGGSLYRFLNSAKTSLVWGEGGGELNVVCGQTVASFFIYFTFSHRMESNSRFWDESRPF